MSRKSVALAAVNKAKPQPRVEASQTGGGDIPDHVWVMLQEAGEAAAERLLELLQPAAFAKLKDGTQKALIDLAMTRAYGLPVKTQVKVVTGEADAVAASLAQLAGQLPERHGAGDTIDVSPEPSPSASGDD